IDNKPIALFGFTSYTKEGEDDPAKRPIIFSFNGGPGSSSYWLHMGVMGPKRIVVNDPGTTPAAPYQLVNNDQSLLDVADLVMIDPVGTGLSVPIGNGKYDDFWGVDGDIESISQFIRQYLIEHGRINSPKYLLGESYGTFRNAGIMAHLQDQGIALNGVIMVSAVFDLRQLLFPPGDDLPYIVHMPTYAATAWYHDKITDKMGGIEPFIDAVRTFTKNEYAPALFSGDQLRTGEKESIANKLATFTGLSAEYWLKANLRVTNSEFFAELLRDEGQSVGRLDSRFTGINQDLLSQTADYDPQSKAISHAYTAGFFDYFYNQLNVDKKLHYQTSAGSREGFKWNWSHTGNNAWGTQVAISTAGDMARAMSQNPHLKVLILNGYYDIATVFYGVEYTIDHLGLPPEIKDNIIMEYYEAGHMMYTHKPSLEKFRSDVLKFIADTDNL
ncbi:MAG: carboxypeptidase, partial [Saprospiraceae bacterium]|nr:carboxypeptidase [Saprospiraceae bacterium]